jgi:hypothetical protein
MLLVTYQVMDTTQAVEVEQHSAQNIAPKAESGTPQPEEQQFVSETLYIQNLNEKVKIDGEHR